MPAQIHRRRRLVLSLVAVVVVVAGGSVAAWAMTGDGGSRYRTATAAMGSVEQVLTGVGTVAAVNQASVAFAVSGTVATVPVSVGSKVSAGQTLATLTTTSLNQSLDSANSTLATAKQTLATDQASQTESTVTESAIQSTDSGDSTDSVGAIVLDAAVTPAPSASSRPSGGTGQGSGQGSGQGGQTSGTSTVKTLIAQVTAAQRAVISAQQKLDEDLAAAESALATCQNALSTPVTSSPPSTSATPTDSPTATATATATASAAATPAADSGDATCLAAIKAAPTQADAQHDQQTRDTAEQTLDSAIQKLEQAAAKAASSTGSGSSTGNTGNTGNTGSGSGSTGSKAGGTGSSSRTGNTTGSSTGGSTGNGTTSSNGTRGGSSGPASAAQLAADQAQIDAAQAQLVVAQQNLTAATLTSPLAGTVAAVSITAGKTAGSSSTITVIGTGQSQVTTTVALADIDRVKVGDPTTVKVDGISQSLTGKVSLIGILNTTSGSSTSYPVTILLDPTSQKLYDGSGASTSIQVAQVSNVLTVPSSAVRTLGQFTSVTVLTNGKPVTTRVTVGALGSDRTQILTGLKAGQQVVLANFSEPLPTSSA